MIIQERKHLDNILKDFLEEHETFKPTDEMMTVAQQINHIAHTVVWFREGAFGKGFDLDFEKIEALNRQKISLDEAMLFLEKVYDDYIAFLGGLDEAALSAPMAENPIFGTLPRFVTLFAQNDHTAHHRGALSVYLRLLDITPTMIYTE
jgi:uncharacterized damage-inducible protein DinB